MPGKAIFQRSQLQRECRVMIRLMKKHIFIPVICSVFLLFAGICPAAEMETFNQSVVNAHANAAVPPDVLAKWIPTAASMFKVGVPGSVAAVAYDLKYYNNQLIVRTASTERAYSGYYWPNIPTTAGSDYTIYGKNNVMSAWVTTGREMTGFIDGQGLTAGTVIKGVERGLGMNDGGTHDAIFEMAVTVGAAANPYLLRPTRNPDPTQYSTDAAKHGTNAGFPDTAQAAGIGTGAAADAVYANYQTAYTDWMTANYPWTQLGYTYYWGQAANKPENLSDVQGMSEFILLGGAGGADPTKTPSGTNESGNVVVVGIYATQSYLYTKNDGTALSTAADAQYGNGFASFNVTGPCNTLWAGRDFQVHTSLDAASPNTVTVGADGSVTGGQGILVGSRNYTVTNAGAITANANMKKFNLDGSENIALLFKGDTHATPYIGDVKNILNNSGSIAAPGGNGTAVMVWAGNTNITNTGTISASGMAIKVDAGNALITNSSGGLISGGTYAIQTGAGNDSLTVNGGEIAGRVDLGTGADVLTVSAGSNAKFTFTLNPEAPTAAQIKSQTVSIADNTTTVSVKTTGTGNIKNNEQFLIADATTLTVDPAKLTVQNDPSLPMVAFSAGKTGNQLLLTALRDGTFYAQRSGNASLGAVLDSLANAASGDMATVLGALDASGNAGNAARLQPVVDNSLPQVSRTALGGFLGAVAGRLDQVRPAAQPSAATGISTGDEPFDRGAWAQGFGGYMNQDPRDASNGYDASLWGLATGYDILLNDIIMIGGGIGYARNRINLKNGGGHTEADAYQGTLYASLTKAAYFLDGALSLAFNHYRSSRHIVFPGVDRTAGSEYDGQQYSLYLEGGRTVRAGPLDLAPIVSIRYEHLHIGGYTEKNAGDLNLRVEAQNYDMALAGLGMKAGYSVKRAYGLLKPELRVKWRYDLVNDHQQSTSTFTGGGAAFTTSGFTPARSSLNLGARIALITKNKFEFSMNYDFETKSGFYGHFGYANLRYTF